MTLNKAKILAVRRPEALFPGTPPELKRAFWVLSKRWHPDVTKDGDAVVFAHIVSLRDQAEEKMATGRWDGPSVVEYLDDRGRRRVIESQTGFDFPLGRTIIAPTEVTYVIEAAYEKYARKLVNLPHQFTYASPGMKDECARYLPERFHLRSRQDGRVNVSTVKTPDLIRLRDVIEYCGGTIDPKHVAWIVSSLMNLCCYLEYAGLVHGDISPDTYFISPAHHSGSLLGGWWFATPFGKPVDVLPARTVAVMPATAKAQKRALLGIDHELVRLTGRECLDLGTAPEPMRAWLTAVATGTARDQYRKWVTVLEQSFGQRRFTKMYVTAAHVYGATAARL